MATTDFRALVAAARAGSDEAAAKLFAEYAGQAQRALRRVLDASRRLRLDYDSTDIAQFAWDVLFRRFADWNEIKTPEHLVAVLLKIGTNHIRDQLRRFDNERAGCRQVPLDDARAQSAPDRGDAPDDAMAFQDRLEAVLKRRPAHHREILDLYAKGNTFPGIAKMVGRSASQVRRIVQEIRRDLGG